MEKPARIVLLGNYRPDGQRSMLRFSALLATELAARGWANEVVHPPAWAARWPARHAGGLGKWLAYLDKYVIFPVQLRRRASTAPPGTLFHICDHSNAPYIDCLGKRPVVVTIHDLLAVRGGLGDASVLCPASRAGKFLQRRILNCLKQIPWAACDSEATRDDFFRLSGRNDGERVRVIPLAADPGMRAMDASHVAAALGTSLAHLASQKFLLHVGSAQPRKNREAVIDVMSRLKDAWKGKLVFAGEPMNESQKKRVTENGIRDRVIELGAPEDKVLCALYSSAHALVFPSIAEGFGWPVLEALACGCPVICSNRTSLPEVAGTAALLFEPDDVDGMSQAVLRLNDAAFRQTLITKGARQAAEFSVDRMMDSYLELFRMAVNSAARPD